MHACSLPGSSSATGNSRAMHGVLHHPLTSTPGPTPPCVGRGVLSVSPEARPHEPMPSSLRIIQPPQLKAPTGSSQFADVPTGSTAAAPRTARAASCTFPAKPEILMSSSMAARTSVSDTTGSLAAAHEFSRDEQSPCPACGSSNSPACKFPKSSPTNWELRHRACPQFPRLHSCDWGL